MRFTFLFALMILLSTSAWAQTPSDDGTIDVLLSQDAVTWGQAAWLVGRAAGTFDESVTPGQAAGLASAKGWGDASLIPASVITLAAYSQILVRALAVPGGVFYTLFPGPRYAFRELVFRRILPPTAAPDGPVSGTAALLYLQNAQAWKDGRP